MKGNILLKNYIHENHSNTLIGVYKTKGNFTIENCNFKNILQAAFWSYYYCL
jgi:hypothetical protein